MRETGPRHLGLMRDLIERKIRLDAHQFFEERGRIAGYALEDWLKAESAVLKTSILAPLWRYRNQDQGSSEGPGPISYDSGYEHSLEHWIELQHLLCQDEEDANSPPLVPAHSSYN